MTEQPKEIRVRGMNEISDHDPLPCLECSQRAVFTGVRWWGRYSFQFVYYMFCEACGWARHEIVGGKPSKERLEELFPDQSIRQILKGDTATRLGTIREMEIAVANENIPEFGWIGTPFSIGYESPTDIQGGDLIFQKLKDQWTGLEVVSVYRPGIGEVWNYLWTKEDQNASLADFIGGMGMQILEKMITPRRDDDRATERGK